MKIQKQTTASHPITQHRNLFSIKRKRRSRSPTHSVFYLSCNFKNCNVKQRRSSGGGAKEGTRMPRRRQRVNEVEIKMAMASSSSSASSPVLCPPPPPSQKNPPHFYSLSFSSVLSLSVSSHALASFIFYIPKVYISLNI